MGDRAQYSASMARRHQRRLDRIRRALQPQPAGDAFSADDCSIEHNVSLDAKELTLLDDLQMRTFIGAGWLALAAPELPESFHEAIHSRAEATFGPGRKAGVTNVAVGITPELQLLLRSPTVAGALTSLLGQGFTFGHLGAGGCALHCSMEGGDQLFHKDSQRSGVNGQRTRAVMVMYYPGACDADMGPTAVVPSSHLLAPEGLGLSLGVMAEGAAAVADQEDWTGVQRPTATAPSLEEHLLVLPRGDAAQRIVVIHEDLVHRATSKLGPDAPWRCLFKFTFTRTSEPQGPTWDHQPEQLVRGVGQDWPGLAAAEAWPACEGIWRWHLGEQAAGPEEASSAMDVAALGARLLVDRYDGDEAGRTAAAYQLGLNGGDSALPYLIDALCDVENESARRAGAQGLAVAGERGADTLLELLEDASADDVDASPLTVGSAVEAIGEAAVSPSVELVEALALTMTAQRDAIDAAPASEQPDFHSDDFIVETLQIPVIMPVAHRPVALRYLVLTVAQTALGRVAQRCAGAGDSNVRMALLAALVPWSHSECPRVREENNRAMLSLCVAAGCLSDALDDTERTALVDVRTPATPTTT